MASPQELVPPQMLQAEDQLTRAIATVERKAVDLVSAPWAEIEKSIIKLLGGAFQLQSPDHQVIAFGVAALLATKLRKELSAFWFPQRDSPEGAALGFPDALVTLSPFGAALDALSQAKLERLEALTAELRKSVAASKFSLQSQGPAAQLRPEDYMRLFDAGFIQLTALDPAKVNQLVSGTASAASRDIRDALSRANKLPAEAKRQMEQQIVGALGRLDPGKPLSAQPEATGLFELLLPLFASKAGSGIAPEEFWHDLSFPMAMIGAPEQFPPLEDQDAQAYVAGTPPIVLYVDIVPNQTPSPDEDGLLGLFPVSDIEVPGGAVPRSGVPRLMKVKPDSLRAVLKGLDVAKAKDSLHRFTEALAAKAGKRAPDESHSAQTEEAAWTLLDDARRVMDAVDKGADLYVRRLTEAEASSEPALGVLREALQGPRIILA